MQRKGALIAVFLGLLLGQTTGWTKGQTIRIEIAGDGLTEPIVIDDAELLAQFNIWNGPGVTVTGPDGVPHPPAHVDPEKTHGRFIDWPKGAVASHPAGLQRVEVTFVIGAPRRPEGERFYTVAYELTPEDKQGYVYLPIWTNDLIWHGVEGNWFHSTEKWDELVGTIVRQSTDDLPPVTARAELACSAGEGRMHADGTIEFMLHDKDGSKLSHWRYEPTTENYELVLEHIGNVQPGDEISVSCWPART